MSLGVGGELSVFMQALLAGNLVCLVYEAVRVFRRIFKHNIFWISVEDLLFWFGVAIYLFIRICHTSQGVIRWYFVVGVFIGGSMTAWVLAKIRKKYLAKKKKKE